MRKHHQDPLANSSFDNDDMLSKAEKPVTDLRDSLNENVILSIIRNGKRILVHEAETTHELRVKTTYEKSVYPASTGKMILAHYSPSQLHAFVSRYGLPDSEEWKEVRTMEDLETELEKIRHSQYYVQVNDMDVASVTVPIFSNNKIIASLAVFLPNFRFGPAEKERIIKEIMATARKIQRRP